MTDGLYFTSPQEFRAWLDEHHESATEVWIGYWKKHTGKPSLTWSQAVDEALCFGWIDGVLRRVDDERHVQRFTPRKPTSNWSAVNIAKVEQLRGEGRMRPAGEAAFALRREEKSASTRTSSATRPRSSPSRRRSSGPTPRRGSSGTPPRAATARWRLGGSSAPRSRRRASAGSAC